MEIFFKTIENHKETAFFLGLFILFLAEILSKKED